MGNRYTNKCSECRKWFNWSENAGDTPKGIMCPNCFSLYKKALPLTSNKKEKMKCKCHCHWIWHEEECKGCKLLTKGCIHCKPIEPKFDQLDMEDYAKEVKKSYQKQLIRKGKKLLATEKDMVKNPKTAKERYINQAHQHYNQGVEAILSLIKEGL